MPRKETISKDNVSRKLAIIPILINVKNKIYFTIKPHFIHYHFNVYEN